jgi:hypothetical protein
MKMEQYGVIELADHPTAPYPGTVIVYCLTSDKNIYSRDSSGEIRQLTNVVETEEPIVTDAVAFKVTGESTSPSVGASVTFEPEWDSVVFDTEGTFGSVFDEYYTLPATGLYVIGAFIMATTAHSFRTAVEVYDSIGNNLQAHMITRSLSAVENIRGEVLLYLEEGWTISITVTNLSGSAQTYEIPDSEFYGFLLK